MFYINKRGIVIEAVQWDGSGKSAMQIADIFNVQTEIKDSENWLYKDNMFWGRLRVGDYLFLNLTDKLEILSKNDFEKHFKLIISNARIALIEQFKQEMLLKFSQRQNKGDWRNEKIEAIQLAMLVECRELQVELDKLMMGGKDYTAARKKCADVANYAAITWDLLNVAESNRDDLEKMWDRAESINKGLSGNTYA